MHTCIILLIIITRYNLLPNERVTGGFGAPPQRRRGDGNEPNRRAGHNWGQGQRLG